MFPKPRTAPLVLPASNGPLHVEWDERHKLCLFTFGGVWTWHDCRDALQTASFLRDEYRGSVTYVYDLTASRLPPRLFQDQVKRLLLLDLSPRPGKIMLVDQGQTLPLLLETMRRMYPREMPAVVRIVESIARARTLALES